VPGLHVLTLPSGAKTYRYSFRLRGAKFSTEYSLGRWPGLTLDAAREKAREAAKLVASGKDPRKASPSRSSTWEATLDAWRKDRERHIVTAGEIVAFVKSHTKDLTHRAVGEVTRGEIKALLSAIVDDGKAASAVRLHAHMKAILSWALNEEMIAVSPMASMPAPAPDPEPRRGQGSGKACRAGAPGDWGVQRTRDCQQRGSGLLRWTSCRGYDGLLQGRRDRQGARTRWMRLQLEGLRFYLTLKAAGHHRYASAEHG
jgi:hypothetical protein